jgi:hypothetical protein
VFVLTDLNASLSASAVGTFGAATNINTPLEVNRTGLSNANLNNNWFIGTRDIVNSPMPVELLSFTAEAVHNTAVQLDWKTATETNNDYFLIQRSKDGVSFENIGQVDSRAPNGTSLAPLDYVSFDEAPYQGISYYRLRQTDMDGSFIYSEVVPVDLGNTDLSLLVFPNPSTGDHTYVSVRSSASSEVLVVVYDATGNETYSKVIVTGSTGGNVNAIDLSHKLAAGIYLVVASSDDKIVSQKLIVK